MAVDRGHGPIAVFNETSVQTYPRQDLVSTLDDGSC